VQVPERNPPALAEPGTCQVPEVGVEPTRAEAHWILSPVNGSGPAPTNGARWPAKRCREAMRRKPLKPLARKKIFRKSRERLLTRLTITL